MDNTVARLSLLDTGSFGISSMQIETSFVCEHPQLLCCQYNIKFSFYPLPRFKDNT